MTIRGKAAGVWVRNAVALTDLGLAVAGAAAVRLGLGVLLGSDSRLATVASVAAVWAYLILRQAQERGRRTVSTSCLLASIGWLAVVVAASEDGLLAVMVAGALFGLASIRVRTRAAARSESDHPADSGTV